MPRGRCSSAQELVEHFKNVLQNSELCVINVIYIVKNFLESNFDKYSKDHFHVDFEKTKLILI